MEVAAGARGAATAFSDELRAAAAEVWEAQHAHPFVRGIGDGSLSRERFQHFVRQDYVYLVDYGRLLALACARAPELATMRSFAELTQAILVTEMDLHRAFAADWGIVPAALEAEPATPTTRAYVDFLLRTAALGDFAELVAALLPCMWGYAEVGERLAAAQAGAVVSPGTAALPGAPASPVAVVSPGAPASPVAAASPGAAASPAASASPAGPANPYARWIATYADPEFQALATWCRELMDRLGATADAPTRARLHAAFTTCSRHELAFWDAAWRLEPAPA
ncbi:TenA family protein [Conexibacter sp. CPCC 206217]|uniref:TenA family protein n=1 Tax=Conexibacter sp. CPCC 206217 TaxID=3064574 RepID=UPI00351C1B62